MSEQFKKYSEENKKQAERDKEEEEKKHDDEVKWTRKGKQGKEYSELRKWGDRGR